MRSTGRRGGPRAPSAPSRARPRHAPAAALRPHLSGTWRAPGSIRAEAVGPSSLQALEDVQPVAQQARREEVLADVLLTGPAELLAVVGLAQEPERAVGALLGG